ncbi:MAG TPA: hypothetical protein ENJ84_11910 [Gammaproteobacteria bacterium]|nr:hypothetical protein [Gammaproteobacteria bacterium]
MEHKIDWRLIFFGGVALGLRVSSTATADLAYLLVAAYALLGRAQAIQALAISWLLTNISPGIAPPASMAGLLRFVILFSAAISVFIHGGWSLRRRQAKLFVRTTIILGVFIMGHSLVFSPLSDVSILKALSWTTAMATIIMAWSGLSERVREQLSRQIFGGLVVVLIVSLPLVMSPLGFLKNGTGFQGVFNHPQVFGSVMTLLGAWAAAQIFGKAKPRWWSVVLTGLCVTMILMSEARTAGLALVLGIGFSLMLSPFFAGTTLARMAPGLRSSRVWSIVGVALIVGIVMAPTISQEIHHYITKSGRADVGSLMEAYQDSRGGGIELMLHNILEHPITGIGFGVASIPEMMVVRRDPVFGMPLSAAVEKGVTPVAVLEELGIPGALLVAIWVVMLLQGSARSGLAPFAVCLSVLFLNFGEATLFSTGGAGLLSLVLLGWAFAGGQANSRKYG